MGVHEKPLKTEDRRQESEEYAKPEYPSGAKSAKSLHGAGSRQETVELPKQEYRNQEAEYRASYLNRRLSMTLIG
jgi:hypothetical protein